MAGDASQYTSKSSIFSLCLFVSLYISVSCQQRRPRIVSAPRHPLTVNSKDNATFDWLFELRPTETWTNSIYELIFGIWKYPGFLKTKLMVIDKHGGVLIRPNYERKISCSFNMSRLQVAFTLHNSSTEDEKQYGLHVEFGLARSPLTDTVMLRLQDPPEITNLQQKNISVRIGEDLQIECQAKGLPTPNVTWTRLGRIIKNHTLVLKRVRPSDSGVYQCKAHNKAGEDSREIMVTVSDHDDGSQQITVPSTAARTSEDNSPVWISLAVTVSGLVILTAFTLFLLRLRGRYSRQIPYEPQIDTKALSTYPTPAVI